MREFVRTGTTAGGIRSGSECHTFALDPWYPNKSLSSMSLFFLLYLEMVWSRLGIPPYK